MTREALADRFRRHLDAAGLLDGPGLALLAVSGGPDSLALLDLVAGLARERRLTLCVVHADHGIHEGSARVAEQVRRIAADRYQIETESTSLALGSEAGETEAREARYAFFRDVQQRKNARWLVTAHHADDQAETVMLRLLRGSGTAGLAGMAAAGSRGLIRPLLPFTRAELAEQVRAAGLAAFHDPANADTRHTRSWLRHVIMPALEQRLGADAAQSLLSVAQHASVDLAAWDALLDVLPGLEIRYAEGRFDIARAGLVGYDSVLAARLVRAAARRSDLMIGPAQADRIVRFAKDAASGRTLELGEGLTAQAAFERLVVAHATFAPPPASITSDAGEIRFGGFVLRWQGEPAPAALHRQGWTTWLRPGPVEIRAPQRGERMVPLGGVGHRSVSRLLMEGRVPRGERAGWPLVVREGEPLWIPGVCRGQGAVPEPGTPAVRMDIASAR